MALNPRLLLLMTLVAATVGAAAQDLRRMTPGRRAGRRVVREVVIESDTIAPHADSVLVTAYEKPLRAMRKTFTIVNNTSRPIEATMIDITYRNLSGTMLHRASHTVAT